MPLLLGGDGHFLGSGKLPAACQLALRKASQVLLDAATIHGGQPVVLRDDEQAAPLNGACRSTTRCFRVPDFLGVAATRGHSLIRDLPAVGGLEHTHVCATTTPK